MTATEKIKAQVEDANGLETEMEFIITPDLQEKAILGMDILGKETGFAILPERERLKIGKTEFQLMKKKSGPEIRRIDPEDPLREEEEYGVPPLPETREARDQRKKTWKTALDHDPRKDPNYRETSDDASGRTTDALLSTKHRVATVCHSFPFDGTYHNPWAWC